MHSTSYIHREVYKNYPRNEDTSFNQDTMHGPFYIEKYTKLPLKMRTPPLIRTLCTVPATQRSAQTYPSESLSQGLLCTKQP